LSNKRLEKLLDAGNQMRLDTGVGYREMMRAFCGLSARGLLVVLANLRSADHGRQQSRIAGCVRSIRGAPYALGR